MYRRTRWTGHDALAIAEKVWCRNSCRALSSALRTLRARDDEEANRQQNCSDHQNGRQIRS